MTKGYSYIYHVSRSVRSFSLQLEVSINLDTVVVMSSTYSNHNKGYWSHCKGNGHSFIIRTSLMYRILCQYKEWYFHASNKCIGLHLDLQNANLTRSQVTNLCMEVYGTCSNLIWTITPNLRCSNKLLTLPLTISLQLQLAYIPHPISRNNHHFLDSVLKTTTNMR